MNKILSKNRKGKANPKKAGNQNKTGGMYLAAIPINKLMIKK